MKGMMANENGDIIIANEVVAQYAGLTAVECIGVVGMATISVKDGLVKLLRGDSISKGVNVTIENNKISVDFHIIVAYGVSISVVADNLMSTVKYKLEEFTGLTVTRINIYVEGVRILE
ncbi:MAG: Asp23/Gls24 family envelope stress response protein [Lachnospiraceae bacterium]|nr:Asp23/Gls24 family envelope stress response protein [Lachnospiraceae bacterium]